jgi:hypothetical protein
LWLLTTLCRVAAQSGGGKCHLPAAGPLGSSPSRGPPAVSPPPRSRSTSRLLDRLPPVAPRMPALPTQGMRTLVPPRSAPEPLLWPSLPTRRPTLATLACQSTLQGHRPRQTAPPGPSPPLSPPPTPAHHQPKARAFRRPGRDPATLGLARGPPRHRTDPHAPRPHRGPAPRRDSRKIGGSALRPPGMLCPVPLHGAVAPTAFLFRPLSPGVATRPTAGSTPAAPPPAGRQTAVPPPSRPPVRQLRSCRHILRTLRGEDYPSRAPKTEEGAGGPDAPVPRFLARQGAYRREAAHGGRARTCR